MLMLLPGATGPFFSLNNTDFVVLLGFLLFVAVLLWFKVPGKLTSALDARAATIRKELDDARALREEAQQVLAEFEKRKKEVATQAAGIVSSAKTEAEAAAKEARKDLEASIERRLKAATEQIASAEEAAVREVRERAVNVATAAAAQVIAQKMDPARANALVDTAIENIRGKLH
ncbi:F0F1 ATP synthase subunit B family protein [Halovulum sp. GXIMD14794]